VNLITLIGAAVGSQIICELLFENPVEAARLLGFALTETELCALRAVFKDENRSQPLRFYDVAGAGSGLIGYAYM
jgi:hypothetical protein